MISLLKLLLLSCKTYSFFKTQLESHFPPKAFPLSPGFSHLTYMTFLQCVCSKPLVQQLAQLPDMLLCLFHVFILFPNRPYTQQEQEPYVTISSFFNSHQSLSIGGKRHLKYRTSTGPSLVCLRFVTF